METSGNEDAMKRLGILLLLAVLLCGCVQRAPMETPTPVPAAPTIIAPTASPTAEPIAVAATATPVAAIPTPTAEVVVSPTAAPLDQSDVRCESLEDAGAVPEGLDEAIEHLGFAFHPSNLPDGFKLAGVSTDVEAVRQIYQNGDMNIIIAYPIEFLPDTTSSPLGWKRPDDAVSSLRIGDQTTHVMTGGWSDASIIAGPALSADKAEWDYNKSLALFFICRVGGGYNVEVAIQASPGPVDWIGIREIVDIAQSLNRISGSQQ